MFIKNIRNKEYDIAIIGAGPAGISTALRLEEQTKASIVLVESGGLKYNSRIHELSQVKATGDLSSEYYPVHTQRIFGGTSNVWAGFCTTLEARSFLNREWPINYEDIEAYYKDAAKILDLPKEAYQIPSQSLGKQSHIIYKPFYLSSPVRFNEKYGNIFYKSQSVDVLLNKTCKSILHKAGCVEAVLLQDSEQPSIPAQLLKAKLFVLACGGLGNPRLLQLSGIGQESPVGFYLTQHPLIINVGKVELDRESLDPVLQRISNNRIVHALQLSDDFCLQNNLLNFSVSFFTGSVEERSLLGKRKNVYVSEATIRSEMLSLKRNRVRLGTGFDYLNQPKSQVNFDFEYQRLARDSWYAFAKELLVNGIGRATIPLDSYKNISGSGHYVGTTRIGNSIDDSVADANCKVHNIENLFLVGSSIFPFGGAANPTFSIVAFALRLADHLSKNI